ncbi:MAG: amidohydrolase [Dehalococcoidia bacterium]
MHDLYIRNARIPVGDGAYADAALIRDGRFAFVGAEIDANVAADTQTFDARGRLLLPGFVDGHAHLLGTGFAMRNVDLKETSSAEEAAQRVAARASLGKPGAWIRGAGWDQNDWPRARFPHRNVLDRLIPDHPVALNHTSGHCIWVNSAALGAAGVTREHEAPFGGAIDRDEAGELTGILRDTASKLITDAIPSPSAAERDAAMSEAIAHAHALGVTGVHAMNVGRGEYQAVLALRDSERLRLRIRAFMTADRLDEWLERNLATGDGDDMMRIGGVKFFADGALGSMSAWMLEPYVDVPDAGFPLQPVEELEMKVRACLEHGLAPAVHAIGDRANREVLDLYERLRDVAPTLPRRIEHAQLLTRHEIPRFGALGVTASVQPIHATQDMQKVDRSWGARGDGAYAFASLLNAAATLAFGSDTPVETMDPIAGLHAAVTRQRRDGEPSDGWHPEERISLDAAIRAYTAGCAHAVAEEDVSGRIAEGYFADCVVLSDDLLSVDDPARLLDARVDATIVGGEIVYERN